MPKGAAQPTQAAPGALFRVPGYGVAPRMVQEAGPCAVGTVLNLNLGTNTPAGFQKFQQLDIVRGYLLELDFAVDYEKDASNDAINVSPLAPLNFINTLQVQFESAYNTYRLTGILGFIHQLYRPFFANSSNIQGIGFPAAGAGVTPPATLGGGLYSNAASPLATPNLALVPSQNASGTTQSFKLFLEVPVSMYFDIYFELDIAGHITGQPIHRAIVSPQYMAATTRNVTPLLTYNALQTVNDQYDSPYSPTAAGKLGVIGANGVKVTESWYRDAFIPGNSTLTAPPVYGWQYGLDFINLQPAQANPFPVTLDASVVGQGQILSLVFFIWDPTLNGGAGGVTPIASYALMELLYGSAVQLRQQQPTENMYEWASLHGFVLPTGFFGWDLALTREGLLTNEFALNSLVQAGSQLRLTFATGQAPAASATLYVMLEILKKIGA